MENKATLILLILCGIQLIDAGHFVDDYYISTPDKLDWWGAWKYCTKNGMYLIDLPHDREYQRLHSALKVLENRTIIEQESIWTAGTRQANNLDYYWITTGQPMVWQNWGPENPHNVAHHQCIQLWGQKDYVMVDYPCNLKLVFMCRKTWLSPYLNSKACY